jgi:hypothetical protein
MTEPVNQEIEALAAETAAIQMILTCLFRELAARGEQQQQLVQSVFTEADRIAEVVLMRNGRMTTPGYVKRLLTIIQQLREGVFPTDPKEAA